jgi:hypothetical protein
MPEQPVTPASVFDRKGRKPSVPLFASVLLLYVFLLSVFVWNRQPFATLSTAGWAIVGGVCLSGLALPVVSIMNRGGRRASLSVGAKAVLAAVPVLFILAWVVADMFKVTKTK